jgi:hypothetical protein
MTSSLDDLSVQDSSILNATAPFSTKAGSIKRLRDEAILDLIDLQALTQPPKKHK